MPLVPNARTDAYLLAGTREPAEILADAIARGRAYLDAGASCVFGPGKLDASTIAELVAAFGPGKLSVLGMPGTPSPGELTALGSLGCPTGPTRSNWLFAPSPLAPLAPRSSCPVTTPLAIRPECCRPSPARSSDLAGDPSSALPYDEPPADTAPAASLGTHVCADRGIPLSVARSRVVASSRLVVHGEVLLGGCEGVVCRPEGDPAVGVVVLAGSSGRVDEQRARLLADRGALAVSPRWFGGPGQPAGICEVPLETFTAVVDALAAAGVPRVGVVGMSKGAEAALLVAVRDARVDAVVAISPSAYVWANVGAGLDGAVSPWRSSWTWDGKPVPFVAYDDSWEPSGPEPVSYRSLYEQSLAAFPGQAAAAAIDVENAAADLLLVAGGDDRLWPSERFGREIQDRRQRHGRQVRLIVDAAAGHRPSFPGEAPPPASPARRHGGTTRADRRLGAQAWPQALELLGLHGAQPGPAIAMT